MQSLFHFHVIRSLLVKKKTKTTSRTITKIMHFRRIEPEISCGETVAKMACAVTFESHKQSVQTEVNLPSPHRAHTREQP